LAAFVFFRRLLMQDLLTVSEVAASLPVPASKRSLT
jgi:hypothetical protein